MKKMYIIIIVIIIGLVGGIYLWQKHQAVVNTDRILDQKDAYEYAKAWADSYHYDIRKLKTESNGDFYGILGSIVFDYNASTTTLSVRATVHPHAKGAIKRADVMEELHKIERETPPYVDYAHFELIAGRWQEDTSEPWLYLRLDFKDATMSKSKFVTRLDSLGDTAELWFQNRLDIVLDRVNNKNKAQ